MDRSVERLHERIIKLEEVVMHQQQLLDEINGVVVDLQHRMGTVDARTCAQLERLKSMIEHRLTADLPDEKPPHY